MTCYTFYMKTTKVRVESSVPMPGPRARSGLTSETGRQRMWQNSNIERQGPLVHQSLVGAGTMTYLAGFDKNSPVQAYKRTGVLVLVL